MTGNGLNGRQLHVLALAALLCWAVPAGAQTVAPSTLRQLQAQLGVGQLSPDTSQGRPQRSDQINSSSSSDISEEAEVRRQEARRTLSQLYVPTAVEEDYQHRLDDPTLRQFGYDMFMAGAPPTGVRSGAIGDDYVLGIGDELQISFRGAQTSNETVFVDRDGRVIVGELPPVRAAGRTLGQVRAELAAETKRTTLGTSVFVSVGEVRSVSVFVGGEVYRPGQYNLSSVSSIITALAQAGGVRRSGSLRNVRIVRAGGASVSVDLYGFLGIGTPSAIRLRDGDRIVVPVIGPTVAVVGAVPRAGIYELRGRETVESVVRFAGGALRQRGAKVVISRVAANGEDVYQHADGPGATVSGSDVIQVVSGSTGGARNRVRLDGNVDNAGSRALALVRTVSDLVGLPEGLRPDTYMLAAVLQRRDPSSGGRVFEVVNLTDELRGYSSTTLQSEDRLTIFSRRDIAFLNSDAVRQIIFPEEADKPDPDQEKTGAPSREGEQCSALASLKEILKRSPQQRFNALSRSAFFRPGRNTQQRNASMMANLRDAQTTASPLQNQAGMTADQPPKEEPELTPEQEAEQSAQKEAACPTVFRRDPELAAVLLDSSVSVGGAVRRSGAYPVGGAVTARDLSLVADGLLPGVQGLKLSVTRAVGEAEQIDGAAALQTVRLTAGDDIFFNALDDAFERRGVDVSGEVLRPGYYTIQKGERLSDLLRKAGGLTSYAYPYGTIFTRQSVREQQREGFARTARELNNSLLSVTARAEKSSMDGLIGAASMVEQLTNVEPSGRMVVEADPRVLAIRPDLDTVLEGGDTVYVPKRPNYVIALGDVNNPGALQFVNGKTPTQYLAEAGGTLSTADRKRAFLVLPDGTAQPIRVGGWTGTGGLPPPPGTTIIVPKNIDPLFRLNIVRDITTIVAQLATSAATIAILATR